MKRIAVIFEGNITQQLGVFNAVINRVAHLLDIAPYDIDVFMIQGYDTGLNRLLHGTPRIHARPTRFSVDGIGVEVLWFKHRLIDSVLQRVFHRQPWFYRRWLRGVGERLKDYDLISSHDRIASLAAWHAVNLSPKPWFITWHGASIYTEPYRHPEVRQVTCDLLQAPTCNFFVSRGLVTQAERLCTGFKWQVLCTGARESFTRYDDKRRRSLRKRENVNGRRVIAFVGRLEPVKNVLVLPPLMQALANHGVANAQLWVIGSGSLHDELRQALQAAGVDYRMWGSQSAERMPELMNCIDVLVLPSKLEGMPLVAIEALQCGAHVVASDVVGNAEVVGADNVVALDDHLVENMTSRVAHLLTHTVEQQLPPEVSWEATAQLEKAAYDPYMTE